MGSENILRCSECFPESLNELLEGLLQGCGQKKIEETMKHRSNPKGPSKKTTAASGMERNQEKKNSSQAVHPISAKNPYTQKIYIHPPKKKKKNSCLYLGHSLHLGCISNQSTELPPYFVLRIVVGQISALSKNTCNHPQKQHQHQQQ